MDNQLQSLGGNGVQASIPETFLQTVQQTYERLEGENQILRKSLEDLSREFVQINRKLQTDLRAQNEALQKLDQMPSQAESLLSSLPDASLITDASGNRVASNVAWSSLFGVSQENLDHLRSQSTFPFLSQCFQEPQAFLQIAQGMGGLAERHVHETLNLADGREIEVRSRPLISKQGKSSRIWIFRDTTSLARIRQKLKESEERFLVAAQGANDGLWDWHLKTDELYLSPRWMSMLGYAERDFHNNLADWLNLIHPADKKEFAAKLKEHMARRSKRFRHEYRIMDKMGEYRWVLAQGVLILDEKGDPHRFAGSQTDITEKKRMEKQLIHDTLHDPLTNLPNRILFREHISRSLDRAKAGQGTSFALIQLNLDGFQLINNGMGHLFGDQVLVVIALRLLELAGNTNCVARLAGDEFSILLDTPHNTQSIEEFVNKLINIIGNPIPVNGQDLVLSAGIGVVLHSPHHASVAHLLGDVATAMHFAKAKGAGRWVLFSEDMRAEAVSRLKLETRLRKALENDEIQVYLQPMLRSSDLRITGFEALARWTDTQEGVIHPGAFIPVAEQTGLIIPLGECILRKACLAAVSWFRDGFHNVYVSVNLSARQFQQPDLIARISKVLETSGLPSHLLHLEITESQIMENPAKAIEVLQGLQSLGVGISIDDFGTGYSSLAYLKRFPINTLKIDRTFVMDLPDDSEDAAITRAIIALAHSLHLSVVAEGVETQEQGQFLREAGCEQLQGFYYSRPMPSEQAQAWIKKWEPPEQLSLSS